MADRTDTDVAHLSAALDRLFAPIAHAANEVAAFAYLDRAGALLGARHVTSGRVDTIDVPVRIIAADALAFDAAMVTMAHNHPSGDLSFSAADLVLTRRLARGLDALGIRLVDHWLLTRDGRTSLAAQSLI